VKSRRLAPLALIAAVMVGTSGCAMLAPQATTIEYNPAEGAGATTGSVVVSNAVVVSEDGEDGNLIAAFTNESDEAQTVSIEFEGSSSTETLRIPAMSSISLGMDPDADSETAEGRVDGGEPILLEGIDTPPGATLPIYFQSGDAEGELIQVPVLDGSVEYLAPFVP
jgi:hypothetical protein